MCHGYLPSFLKDKLEPPEILCCFHRHTSVDHLAGSCAHTRNHPPCPNSQLGHFPAVSMKAEPCGGVWSGTAGTLLCFAAGGWSSGRQHWLVCSERCQSPVPRSRAKKQLGFKEEEGEAVITCPPACPGKVWVCWCQGQQGTLGHAGNCIARMKVF